MVGDQNREPGFAQVDHDLLHIVDRDRVHPAEGLVQHQESRIGHERTRDRQPPFLAATQSKRSIFRDLLDSELVQQLFAPLAAFLFRKRERFQDGQDIFLHGEFAKDRFLLRQVTHPEARAFVHRVVRHVRAVKKDATVVGPHQAYDHIEAGRLAGAVRAEQADDLARAHVNVHPIHHRAAVVDFHQLFRRQDGPSRCRNGGPGGDRLRRLGGYSLAVHGLGDCSTFGSWRSSVRLGPRVVSWPL